jgi:quinol monooxygenase YgiN
MYSVVVTLSVRPGQEGAFEAALTELKRAVEASEPETVCYHVVRLRDDPQRYRVIEMYRSKEAFKAHLASAHVAKSNATVKELLGAPPQIEVVEVVA